MAEKKFNFYGGKSSTLPRFVYRRLAQALQDNTAPRAALIDAAIAELLTGKDPDLRKFKFSAPAFFKQTLEPAELAHFEEQLSKRHARASQLKMVFPHVSDEFSVDRGFLEFGFRDANRASPATRKKLLHDRLLLRAQHRAISRRQWTSRQDLRTCRGSEFSDVQRLSAEAHAGNAA